MTMFILKIYSRWLIYSCFTILATQVTCEEFSECYDNVNICLWTDGSDLTQSAAQTACQQRNTFLPRITNRIIQSKLAEFRDADHASNNLLLGRGFWIDVKAVAINNWHWIDGSPLATEVHVYDQTNDWLRFAVIVYNNNNLKQFVYSARKWTDYLVSSYICQLQTGASCAASDLSINSKCYRKFHNSSSLSWFSASNDCLSRNGSLAVFTDVGRPSVDRQLTDWLNATGTVTDKTYWIGLIRSWWKTTNEDGRAVDVQYSNWENGHPNTGHNCVIVTKTNHWNTAEKCSIQQKYEDSQKYVCQNYTGRTTPITTTTTTAPMNSPTPPTNTPSRTNDSTSGIPPSSISEPDGGGGDNQSLIIGVAVGATVVVLIIIAIIIIAVLLLKKKRDSAADTARDYETLDTQRQGQHPHPAGHDYETLNTQRQGQQPHPAGHDYETLNTQRQGQQPHPAAHDYETLNIQRQGQQPHYEVVALDDIQTRPHNAPHQSETYENAAVAAAAAQ